MREEVIRRALDTAKKKAAERRVVNSAMRLYRYFGSKQPATKYAANHRLNALIAACGALEWLRVRRG